MSAKNWALIDEPFVAYLPSLAKHLGSPVRAIILQALWFARNEQGETAMTQATLADRTGISVRAVRDNVKWLRDNGHLHTRRSSVWDATTVWVVTLDGEPAEDDEPEAGEVADEPESEPESADPEDDRHTDAAGSATSADAEEEDVTSMRQDLPPLDVAESAASSYKNLEEPAAAVSNSGTEQQQEQTMEDATSTGMCDLDTAHGEHHWWKQPDAAGRQHRVWCPGIDGVSAMEEAVGVVADALGGTVIADSAPSGAAARGLPPGPVRVLGPDEHLHVRNPHDTCPECRGPGGEHKMDCSRREGRGATIPMVAEPVPHSEAGPRPFPAVWQRNLVTWFGVTANEGQAWEQSWFAAEGVAAGTEMAREMYYDPEAHLAIYVSRCRHEGRVPRSDLWLRFFIEDRAKHIQTLREEAEKSARRDEDPNEREARGMRALPPADWGIGEGE